MSTDIINASITLNTDPFVDIDNTFLNDDDQPNDDVFVKRTNKTLRRYYNGADNLESFVYCMRDYCNGIPTTDIDSLLPMGYIYMSYARKGRWGYYGTAFPLSHCRLYDTLIDALEKNYISKTSTYDKRTGFDEMVYTVDATGNIDTASLYHDDIYQPIACPKKTYNKQTSQQKTSRRKFCSWRAYNTKKNAVADYNYIIINGNKYSVNNVYKRSGNDFVPVIIHKTPDTPILNIDEVSIRNHCSINIAITVNFSKDTVLNGLVLMPEPMKFENIYEDNVTRRSQRNRRSRRNGLGYIKCLTNDPGFITKFELYYRSSLTNSQWIKYNIFDGNVSNHEPVKIVFDETITAKQIRLVPLSYYKSFDKVIVTPFATKIPDDNDNDGTVTYIVNTPRNTRGIYSYEQDTLWSGRYSRRNIKGDEKKKHREFTELCNL